MGFLTVIRRLAGVLLIVAAMAVYAMFMTGSVSPKGVPGHASVAKR